MVVVSEKHQENKFSFRWFTYLVAVIKFLNEMIQSNSELVISDNSGGKRFKSIKIRGGFKKRYAYIGSKIVGSIQGIRHYKKRKLKVKNGEVLEALIIRTRSKFFRPNFSGSVFKENAVVLLNKKNQPIATRVMGPVLHELRKSKYMKVASLASGFC